MSETSDSFAFQGEDEAATPLTNDEKTGLIPSWVTYRYELNEVEQANITKGVQWAIRQKRRELLEERFIRDLHQRMLGEVWTWAGHYRTTERNIGVPAWRITTDLHGLLDDTRFWAEQKVFDPDELAVRFHHRLVADLLVIRLGGTAFSWGGGDAAQAGELRTRYVTALRQADANDIAALVQFARS